MIEETQQDQAALHALGMLEGEEAAAFRAALAREPELQALADEIAEAAATLTHALPSTKAPAEILPRLLAQIRAERMHATAPRAQATASSGGWMPWALAASIALAAAVGFVSGSKVTSVNSDEQIAGLKSQIEQADIEQQRLAAIIAALKEERVGLEKRVADLRQRDLLSQVKIATLEVKLRSYAKVLAYAVWDSTAQQGFMRFTNLPAAAADKDYQMWIIDPRYDAPVSAGIFTAGGAGELDVKFKPTRPIALADKFAVSVEQKGGSTKPLGPIVLLSN